MRLEQLPIILGIIVALIGLTMALDAWQAGGIAPFRERRRRTRAVPHKAGQTLVAVGTICLGIALIGRDTWKYTTVTVLLGVVLLVLGAIMNRVYLKEVLLFRGAARRGEGEENSRLKKEPPGKSRIR
jgi:glucose uptake protein GlcU